MGESGRSGGARSVPIKWLYNTFQTIPVNADHETMKGHLFAYLLWLFDMMFSSSHGDVVLPGLIKFAKKIVDKHLPQNPKYSFGSAMLSHTYRGLCDATQKSSFAKKAPLLCVSYEFLQPWSWEYLPVGRPQIINPIHLYSWGVSFHNPLTISSRRTHAQKQWSTNLVKGCYPEYHQQFELLDELLITWNPWTQRDIQMVFSARISTECVRDSGFWLTRCNLLYIRFVEPYNSERVMRQFGLYQVILPSLPRCVDDETHKQSNSGRGGYDWSAHNIQWIDQWNSEALINIVHQPR